MSELDVAPSVWSMRQMRAPVDTIVGLGFRKNVSFVLTKTKKRGSHSHFET